MEIQTTKTEEVRDKEMEAAMSGIKPNMTRKERRKWYKENRKKLGLPSWGELQNIKAI